MDYISHNGHELVPKNNLQKAIAKFLKEQDRQLIRGQFKLKLFKKSVLAKIEELNKEHSRCRRVEARWFETDPNDWLLVGPYANSFIIYHCKKEY